MVFHLGALLRLNEAGILRKLTRVSSVSGGSITAAVLGLAGGFLLIRGVRINRDHRSFQAAQARVSVQPWASVQRPSAGLSLRLSF